MKMYSKKRIEKELQFIENEVLHNIIRDLYETIKEVIEYTQELDTRIKKLRMSKSENKIA